MSRDNRDWILLRGGTPEAIRKAVTRHAGLFAHKVPSKHRVLVYRLDGDEHAVRFDPSLPPYAFANLINWLDDPRMSKGAGAVGWFASPGTGVRYSLAPKRAGKGGDTLVGVSDAGDQIEVFLPSGRLRRTRHDAAPAVEPEVSFAELSPVAEFEIEVDADRSFGNPDFVTG
jgi:hypothetical protein